MDMLPEELIVSILTKLPCRTMFWMKNCDEKLRDIINKYNLMNKINFNGYPRKNGHCFCHYVNDDIALDLVLDNLYKQNSDLVRGDLILLPNHKTCIYDGCKIIKMEYEYDYKVTVNLPKEFNTITNGVPINYWCDDDDNTGIVSNLCYDELHNKIIILHGRTVWLDISQIREQLLKNLFVANDRYCSKFTFNNTPHCIFFGAKDEEKVKSLLLKHDLIKFSTYNYNNLYI